MLMSSSRALIVPLCVLLFAVPSLASAEDDPFGPTGDDPFGPAGDDPFGDRDSVSAGDGGVRMELDPLIGRVRVGLGGLAAMRSNQITGVFDTFEHAPPLYYGGALELDASLATFESLDATLRLVLEGAFGASRNQEIAPELGRQPLSDHFQGAARLAITRAIFQSTDLTASAGVQGTSFTVEPNNTYTGNRYLSALIALELTQWLADDLFGLSVRAAALPVFASNASAGADGDTTSFGWRVGGGLIWNIVPSYNDPTRAKIALELRYVHQHFTTQYPSSMRWGAADGEDSHDILNLMFHISL
jgi:hypothetical protein